MQFTQADFKHRRASGRAATKAPSLTWPGLARARPLRKVSSSVLSRPSSVAQVALLVARLFSFSLRQTRLVACGTREMRLSRRPEPSRAGPNLAADAPPGVRPFRAQQQAHLLRLLPPVCLARTTPGALGSLGAENGSALLATRARLLERKSPGNIRSARHSYRTERAL